MPLSNTLAILTVVSEWRLQGPKEKSKFFDAFINEFHPKNEEKTKKILFAKKQKLMVRINGLVRLLGRPKVEEKHIKAFVKRTMDKLFLSTLPFTFYDYEAWKKRIPSAARKTIKDWGPSSHVAWSRICDMVFDPLINAIKYPGMED